MERSMTVKFKRMKEGAVVPKYKTLQSAGCDLYTCEDTVVHEGRNLVKLGFGIQLPVGTEAQVRPRSGCSIKGMPTDLEQINADADVLLGTIDADYRGECGVIIKSTETFTIPKGTRIAQMVISKYERAEYEEVDTLDEGGDRGTGGFGSTGVK